MAYKIVRIENDLHQRGTEIVAVLDSDSDLAALAQSGEYATGSIAIVMAAEGKMYGVNASGQWVEV